MFVISHISEGDLDRIASRIVLLLLGAITVLAFIVWAGAMLARYLDRRCNSKHSVRNSFSTIRKSTIIGIGLGVAIGATAGPMETWIAIGLVLGLIIGFWIDMNRRRQDEEKAD